MFAAYVFEQIRSLRGRALCYKPLIPPWPRPPRLEADSKGKVGKEEADRRKVLPASANILGRLQTCRKHATTFTLLSRLRRVPAKGEG